MLICETICLPHYYLIKKNSFLVPLDISTLRGPRWQAPYKKKTKLSSALAGVAQ